MKLRNGKIIKNCNHNGCTLWLKKDKCCCFCADTRPQQYIYIAHNRSNLCDISYVERNHYYCSSCKNFSGFVPEIVVSEPVVVPKTTQQLLDEALEEIIKLKNKIKILKADYGDNQLLKKKISSLEAENAKLKEDKINKKKEQKIQNLCDSGMMSLVYHLGYCSDVLGDCWIPAYEKSGLSGLKKELWETSEYVHKGKHCSECEETINHIHA